MEKSFKELVDLYYQKKIEGMDFSQIRKELADKNVDEDLIKDVVRAIDDRMLRGEVKKTGKSKAREFRLMGWTLMIIGGIITLGTYFKWFDMHGYYFVSYGPVIAGYLLIVAARRAQRKAS
ncbi:hypothetical protein BZG02_14955 [Labilibaculum filiforme]|uniref:Uncharacterized protein n=1 Tax=Labilibaculum filiforme TaxID=1940526 RepID=A0A2N3HUL8_9BACT|nr:hypothetical protein [Labilibaculum filiforme]PKQ61721.1 hypothetical protein BZG02_14955 [Labilibaculum filiforme]